VFSTSQHRRLRLSLTFKARLSRLSGRELDPRRIAPNQRLPPAGDAAVAGPMGLWCTIIRRFEVSPTPA